MAAPDLLSSTHPPKQRDLRLRITSTCTLQDYSVRSSFFGSSSHSYHSDFRKPRVCIAYNSSVMEPHLHLLDFGQAALESASALPDQSWTSQQTPGRPGLLPRTLSRCTAYSSPSLRQSVPLDGSGFRGSRKLPSDSCLRPLSTSVPLDQAASQLHYGDRRSQRNITRCGAMGEDPRLNHKVLRDFQAGLHPETRSGVFWKSKSSGCGLPDEQVFARWRVRRGPRRIRAVQTQAVRFWYTMTSFTVDGVS
jgi:hypothetical protein